MTLSTSVRNINIKNNSIDIGFSSTGSMPANYTYASNLSLGGDAVVAGNMFKGCIGNGSGSTNLMTVSSGTSTITNNNFIRGAGSPVATYIAITSASDQIIKDNIFDQSTVDGTTDVLVTGLSSGSIYHSNKNQIIYIPISAAGGTFTSDIINGNVSADAGASVVTTGFNYLSVFFDNVSPRSFYVNFDLNSCMPDSTKLLTAKIGIFNINIGAGTLTSGAFVIQIATDNVVPANFTTGVNSILDVKNNGSSLLDSFSDSLDLFANYAAVQANTLYLTANSSDASDSNNFINTKDKCMTVQVYIANDINTLGAGQAWKISPLVLKCIW